jgi:gluconokinase
MTVPSSNVRCPRSAYDEVGGLVYFARMLDKIRLRAEGKLPPDYYTNLGKGFDGRCIRFLGVSYTALCDRVSQGGSDEEILKWCFETGRNLTEEEVLVWNSFLRKRGWRDEADGTTQELENYKSRSGLAQRADIQTFFDYYEVDEGRRP